MKAKLVFFKSCKTKGKEKRSYVLPVMVVKLLKVSKGEYKELVKEGGG